MGTENLQKIAVIGAGYSGLLTSMVLARLGYSVDIYEEHDKVGFPKHCTGLVSQEVVDFLEPISRDIIESQFHKIKFIDEKTNRYLEIRLASPVYRIDRVKTEKLLLNESVRYGASIRYGHKIKGIRVKENKVSLVASNGEQADYDIAIIAEGLGGGLRRSLGILHTPVWSYGINLDYDINSVAPEKNIIEIHVDSSVPGTLYGWRFTVAERYVVVGGLSFDPIGLRRLIRNLSPAEKKRREIYGGRVIHGPPLPCRRQGGSIFITGDAAAMNKPLTGGGLYPVTVMARILQDRINQGDGLREALLHSYCAVENMLNKQYRFVRELLDSKILSLLLSYGSRLGLSDIVLEYDRHESLPSRVLKQKPLQSLLFGILILVTRPRLASHMVRGMMH
ncbi:MAG: NAD(P)/FAD-dependent oxidoreductase [Desulfurococcales archaeon]|nr:NAD(P)/FAD-dependent oxidoreductase [Desulfurococcales archaeon]